MILADINAAMLTVGRDRLIDKGATGNVQVVQADAQALPFDDNSIDCITIAFGLRNVTDKAMALRSMLRVLRPGGRLLVLEFSTAHSRRFWASCTISIRFKYCPQWVDSLRRMQKAIGIWQSQSASTQTKKRC